MDAIKEQYYPARSYDDLYTKWTTLRQERDQAVPDFKNIFHTLHTKLGIKDSKWNLVLKYRGDLHRYIHTEMEFLDISSLGVAYWYAVKIKQKLKQKTWQFGPGNPSQKSQERAAPTHQTKRKENMDNIKTTSPSQKKRRTLERQSKIPRSGVTSMRALGITLLTTTQSSYWWPKWKPLN